MEFTGPEANNTGCPRKRAIEELVRGRKWAYELQLGMLRRSSSSTTTTLCVAPTINYATNTSFTDDHRHQDQDQDLQDDLVAKILGSFTQVLSLINSVGEANDEVSQLPLTASNSEGGRKPPLQDSSEFICKSSAAAAASKDRRGCYKRRRTTETWWRESPTLVDDGHGWRKYGQKVILNAEYPRNYFRCTHKFDQGCQATKQVQKIQEDPPVFRTTYHGRHTCKNPPDEHKIIYAHADAAAAARDSSIILSFESNQVPNMIARSNESSSSSSLINKAVPVPVPVPVPALTKQQEMKEAEVVHNHTCTRTSTLFQNHHSSSSSSSSSDHQFLSQEDFTVAMSSGGCSDYGGAVISSGVYASSYSTTETSTTTNPIRHTHTLEMDRMDMVLVNDDFDDFEQFDFDN